MEIELASVFAIGLLLGIIAMAVVAGILLDAAERAHNRRQALRDAEDGSIVIPFPRKRTRRNLGA